VAFQSDATSPSWRHRSRDDFVHDRQSGATERVSVDSGGSGNGHSRTPMSPPTAVSLRSSLATSLVLADTNGFDDIFLRDRNATGFTSICDAGQGG
jgi:hypothetical protein